MDADVFSLVRHPEEHGAAEALADEGGDGGTRDAHGKIKDEQWGKDEIEEHSRHDSLHCIHRIALEAHQIVECQRGRHEGSAQQDDAEIALGVGLDGGGGTQKNAQWCKEKLSKNGDEKSRQETQHEARGCHLLRLLHLLGSQHSGNIVAGAMTIEETNGLDY